MKQIIEKTIIIIDGKEFITRSCDFSQCVSEYEKEQECELDDQEIIDYISES